MKREKNAELEELFKLKIPVYSYSRLSSYHQCKYNYYEGYILKRRSPENIYGLVGGVSHDGLEELYRDGIPIKEVEQKFMDCISESAKNGIKFPENPPTTKQNYIKNMSHFFNNYQTMDVKMKTEQFVLVKFPRFEGAIEKKDFIYIQMFIDSIYPVFKEVDGKQIFDSVVVNDWKTSSKFDKHALEKSSKQLLLYKIGVEQTTGVPVSKLIWNMLKYTHCCTYNAKGGIKRSALQQRKDAVKFFVKPMVKDLIKSGMDTMDAELLVGKCVNHNSFEFLPDDIRERYWLEDGVVECEFNDEIIETTKQWIIDTVLEIESLGDDVKNYPSVEITEKNNYFCNNLCQRNCEAIKKYNNANRDIYKKKKEEKEKVTEIENPVSKFNLDSLFD